MKVSNIKPVWWLMRDGGTVMISPDLTHLFRIIARLLRANISSVTVKQAVDAGFEIRRA